MWKVKQMTPHDTNHSNKVRVSILFKPALRDAGAKNDRQSNYQRHVKSMQANRAALIAWMEQKQVNFSPTSITEMDAFDTIFVDVERDDVKKIEAAPMVEDVTIDGEMKIELLSDDEAT